MRNNGPWNGENGPLCETMDLEAERMDLCVKQWTLEQKEWTFVEELHETTHPAIARWVVFV